MSIKRAIVFAGYSYDGKIFEDNFPYLEELKNYADYIVAVYDNKKLDDNDVKKLLDKYVDACIIGRHEEYDFGSSFIFKPPNCE